MRAPQATTTESPQPADWEVFTDLAPLTAADNYLWRGSGSVPVVGEEIMVTLNGLGRGKVRGYFLATGTKEGPRFLGLAVDLHRPPGWYVEQLKRDGHSGKEHAFVFGPEMKRL